MSDGLAKAMRARVHALHTTAERSGIVQDILRGKATVAGYAMLLRNLLPAYQALEAGLDRHRDGPLRDLANPALYRAAAIERDLAIMTGPAWPPLLSAGQVYAERVATVADGDGGRLIAHAYSRYLGDLSGGQTMRRLLGRDLGVPDAALSLYDFPELGDLEAFKVRYRDAIDRAGHLITDPDAVVEEAAIAFSLNIDLSVAVQHAC